MSMDFNLAGISHAVMFVGAYAPADTSKSGEDTHMFWTELDNNVNQNPKKHHLLLSMDANTRTGERAGGEECDIVGAYGWDSRTINSNVISLLQFAGDNRLAPTNTYFLHLPGKYIAYIRRQCESSREQITY